MSLESITANDQYINKISIGSESKIHHHHQHKNVDYGKAYFAISMAAFSSFGVDGFLGMIKVLLVV